jgi:GNAT superfamily N-acetyltransferase
MTVAFRPGTIEDSFAVFEVFGKSVNDLVTRLNVNPLPGADDPEARAEIWKRRKPMFEHMARTAYEFWVAEQDGRIVGYARSILRDGNLELTEFFVLPETQSAGIGGELLRRTFPLDAPGVQHRTIIATTDVRAQVRYLKAGVVPRFPEMYWTRAPENVPIETDMEFVKASSSSETLDHLANIDRVVLGHTRTADHEYLLASRDAFLYKRGEDVVGYGYLSMGCGPIALLDSRDFAAVMAHAEANAFARGYDQVGFDIPMLNRAAIDYVLARRYKLDPFIAFFMSDQPYGKFENYILTSPPYFI